MPLTPEQRTERVQQIYDGLIREEAEKKAAEIAQHDEELQRKAFLQVLNEEHEQEQIDAEMERWPGMAQVDETS